MIQSADRDSLITHLIEAGVEAKVHYPLPLHLQKPGREMGHHPGDLPVAERQANLIVTLPAHEYLTDEQVDYCCGSIERFFGVVN
jgi:dTDP-4-amino-4,6-dideoxygalactose transaminase